MKEMRLRGMSDMAAGNAYLPEFMADFNRRFALVRIHPQEVPVLEARRHARAGHAQEELV